MHDCVYIYSDYVYTCVTSCLHTSIPQIAKLNAKANEAMMLKFGRVVDLDRLEGLSVNHIVEELRSKLRSLEEKAGNDLALLSRNIDAEKQRLAQITRENTRRLNRENELITAKQKLEDNLNARQKSMVCINNISMAVNRCP